MLPAGCDVKYMAANVPIERLSEKEDRILYFASGWAHTVQF